MSAVGIALMGLRFRAGDLVVAASGNSEAEALARVANMGLRISFVIAAVIMAVAAILETRRVARARTRPPVSA